MPTKPEPQPTAETAPRPENSPTKEKKGERGKKFALKFTLRTLARIISVFCVILSLGAIALTGLFIFENLQDVSGGHFSLSETGRRTVESINLKRLDELIAQIDEKNHLDEPRQGRLNNPFLDPRLKFSPTTEATPEEAE